MSEERLFFDDERLVILPELDKFVPHPEFEQHVNDEEVHIDEDFRKKVNKLVQYPEPDTLLLRSEMTDVQISVFNDIVTPVTEKGIEGIVIDVAALKQYIVDNGYMTDNLLNLDGARETDPASMIDGVYNIQFSNASVPEHTYCTVYGVDADGQVEWLSSTYQEVSENAFCAFPREMDFTQYQQIVIFFTSTHMYKQKLFVPLGDCVDVQMQLIRQSGTPWVGCVNGGIVATDGLAPVFALNVNPALDGIYVK